MERNFNTHLYFIRDRLSHTAESAVIQSLNDATAVRGFKAFLQADDKRRKEENMPLIAPLERELVHICALDGDNRILSSSDNFDENSYRLVVTGDKVDEYIDEVHQGLREGDDENE